MMSRNRTRTKYRHNPNETVEDVFEGFHGRPSSGVTIVDDELYIPTNMAELGILKKLIVVGLDGVKVDLSRFKKAILSTNRDRNQLYVEDGDQQIDIEEAFGVEPLHEKEVLGEVVQIEYFTTKDHLGSDGGEAIYHHKFGEKGGVGPMLVYDTRNQAISFVGGSYVILDEGIDN